MYVMIEDMRTSLPVLVLFFPLDQILVFFHSLQFLRLFQDDMVFRTCGKDTASTQVSMRIQIEDFSESLHISLAVRLCGSAVEMAGTVPYEVTQTFAELFASCVERPISAWELFVTHCLV